MTECQHISTLTALGMNCLLWGEWEKCGFGLMARIPHAFATEEIEPNSLGTCKFGLIV
jgi:hypothetical protein